jgi:hypothetical protein
VEEVEEVIPGDDEVDVMTGVDEVLLTEVLVVGTDDEVVSTEGLELLVEPLVEVLVAGVVSEVTPSKHAFMETLNFISSAEGFFTTSSIISTASGMPWKRTMLSGDSF